MGSTWSKVATNRISRRRALIASAGLGLSAAFLAACGGGGSDDKPSNNTTSDGKSSLVTKNTDTTAQAKRGGVLKDYAQAEPRTLDPVQPLADYNRIAPFVYSSLLVAKPGHLAPSTGELQGQLAQSYETSPDGLQVTFKLRPGVKWH